MASNGDGLVYLIAGFGFGCFIFIRGFKLSKERQLIENTPTSKIRSLAMGRIEIFGKVILSKNNVIKTPFTNKPCVYCNWIIEEYRRSGKHSRWVTVKKGYLKQNFYLQDKTGKVLVDPTNANLDLKKDTRLTSSGLGLNGKKFLENNRIKAKNFLGINKNMRFTEYYITANDEVYVMGTAGDNPHVIDGTKIKNEDDIMIQKGRKSNFYYISDSSEKDLLKKMRWKIIGGLYGGAALIITTLAMLFAYFRIL